MHQLSLDIEALHKYMFDAHPNLLLAKSTLGEHGGVGLFAKDFIPDETIMCYFWGHVVLATHAHMLDPKNDALHSGLWQNILQFPDQPFNSVVYPSTMQESDKDAQLHLYQVGSNCCYASFANSAEPDACNARIFAKIPAWWPSKDGYKDLDQFHRVITSPILCLQATEQSTPALKSWHTPRCSPLHF